MKHLKTISLFSAFSACALFIVSFFNMLNVLNHSPEKAPLIFSMAVMIKISMLTFGIIGLTTGYFSLKQKASIYNITGVALSIIIILLTLFPFWIILMF